REPGHQRLAGVVDHRVHRIARRHVALAVLPVGPEVPVQMDVDVDHPGQECLVAEIVGDGPGALIDGGNLGTLHLDYRVLERVAASVERARGADGDHRGATPALTATTGTSLGSASGRLSLRCTLTVRGGSYEQDGAARCGQHGCGSRSHERS